jgi:hypothetical protein
MFAESGRRESNPRSQLGKPLEQIFPTCEKAEIARWIVIRTQSVLFANALYLSLRVARNRAESASGTLWHGSPGGSQLRKLRTLADQT